MSHRLKSHSHIEMLLAKKEALEQKIHDEEKRPFPDEVALHQMKREKLHLNDEVFQLQKTG